MESRSPSKRRANAVAEEADDRLSAFPDDLLHSILRFVPLKQAVRTSALSRRWPRLWLGALAASPVLDFGDHAFARRQPPAQAAATVRRCLRLHADRGARLVVFRVAFRSPAGGFRWDVVAWVAAAVARGASEVELDLTPTRWRRVVDDRWGVDVEGSDLFLELPADLFRATNSSVRLALVRCSLRAVPPALELQLLLPSLGDDDVDRIAGFFEFTRPPILDRLFIHVPVGGKRSSHSGSSSVGEDDDDAGTTASISDLVLDHLKLIKVVNFRGTRCEMRLLRFLVDSAPALEQLVLVTVEVEKGTLRNKQMKVIQSRVMEIRRATVTLCRPSEDGRPIRLDYARTPRLSENS